MKSLINKIILLLAIPIAFIGCDDREIVSLNPNAALTANLSATSVVLQSDNADLDALTVSWNQPDYGYDAAPSYQILIDNVGNDFADAQVINVGGGLQKVLTTAQLNGFITKLGIEPDVATDVAIKVVAKLGNYHQIESGTVTLNATGYSDVLDLSTTWGVVGSATPNAWDGPDLPFYQTGADKVYVAYVTLIDGEIKFRENNSWDLNYGDDGADGTLEPGGANIAVTAGTYKITMDLNALTYTIEAYTWGVVGSATPNAWDGPDLPLKYDPYSDQWRAIVTLADGEIKFRQNNDWAVNYGDDGADGTLEPGGANMVVSAGNYLVTVNFKTLTYTIEPINLWGIVGSATPNAWDGPDTKFTLDFSKKDVWVLNNMTLTDGEIKFRANDSWDINYGDDGADGSLEAGGANIVVTAGIYDFVLDFSDAANPTYTMTKQ
ncbi:MAG: SusE domain-containing protein [Saprospiraceae bacterium]|nr:SusE domain-containing protein [Saprospiraceae bacterium]